MTQLTFICQDCIEWLSNQEDKSVPNFITGICDLDETDMTMEQYLKFFCTVSSLMFQKLSPFGYAIFIQTDRKYKRSLVDKSYLLTTSAQDHGLKLVFHKIVLHRDVDKTDLYRPTYAHMLCYAHPDMTTGSATPDVIPVSKRLYRNATPFEAVHRAVSFIKRYSKQDSTVVDPFVGRGTVAKVCHDVGISCTGIDIDSKQIEHARKICRSV